MSNANVNHPEQIEKFSTLCESAARESRAEPRRRRLDAVDRCQNDALATGLVDALGADAVQAIMAAAFAKHPWIDDTTFAESIQGREALWENRGRQAAQATWNATQYALRSGGLKALQEQHNRLLDFSQRQLEDLIWSLHKAGAEPRLLQLLAELVDDAERT
jgi:hypothetical protein